MQKFDRISVRESDGVDIVNHTFGLKATRVLDPVFIADQEIYEVLADKSEAMKCPVVQGPYIAAYILDGNQEKKESLLYLSKKLKIPLVILLDGNMEHFKENKAKLNLNPVVENLKVEDWLYYIKNCSYLVTDSCHGASFAILNKKPFVCIGNADRGMSRFHSLSEVFGLQSRFIMDAEEIRKNKSLLYPIDYERVDAILESEKKRSLAWLTEALQAPVLQFGQKGNQFTAKKHSLYDLAVGFYRKYLKNKR